MNQTFKMQRLTALGVAAFTPIARNGRPLAEARHEAEEYAERALTLVARSKDGCESVRLGGSSIRKLPIEGAARTMFFMRLGAWWFPDSFPKFTSEFTASHFPITECWVVTTELEVDAESQEAAERKARFDAVVRVAADPTLLGESDFFCCRLGVASRCI